MAAQLNPSVPNKLEVKSAAHRLIEARALCKAWVTSIVAFLCYVVYYMTDLFFCYRREEWQ